MKDVPVLTRVEARLSVVISAILMLRHFSVESPDESNTLGPMKVLIDHALPFALAHGGFQIQIEQTRMALQAIGVEAEWLRWWDSAQHGDLIHYFGRPTEDYIRLAHAKGTKVVLAELHTGLGSRSATRRAVQKAIMRAAQRGLPRNFTAKLAWQSYRCADGFIALTEWEAFLMRDMFGADPHRVHVIPNGVEAVFQRPHGGADPWLVCTAAIDPRKRIVELAEAAAAAEVPVWIIGRPYAESHPYYLRFLDLQRAHPRWIRYEGAISDRETLAKIYAAARGFVLLSTQESLSLSALEAAAAGCPLLLSDLPWARTVFKEHASYAPIHGNEGGMIDSLRDFYAACPRLPPPGIVVSTWPAIAERLREVYRSILKERF